MKTFTHAHAQVMAQVAVECEFIHEMTFTRFHNYPRAYLIRGLGLGQT